MTAPALQQLRTALRRALADPDTNTGVKREERLHVTVRTLERAAEDVPPEALRSLAALFHKDVLGHPARPDTVLGRIAAGEYRTRPPYGQRLTPASQRYLMDGLVDLNRAARRQPFWWEAPGARPWSRHTHLPLDPEGYHVLRAALSKPTGRPWREPFRLRLLAAVELLWAVGGSTREGLVSLDLKDFTADLATVRMVSNPPGRTEPTVGEFPLPASARDAVGRWLPVRRAVVNAHLRAGEEAAANQAVFVTLRQSTGTYPDGSPRYVPPGIRIAGNGLEINFSRWAAQFNQIHKGQPGWPVPTDLYKIARGTPK